MLPLHKYFSQHACLLLHIHCPGQDRKVYSLLLFELFGSNCGTLQITPPLHHSPLAFSGSTSRQHTLPNFINQFQIQVSYVVADTITWQQLTVIHLN